MKLSSPSPEYEAVEKEISKAVSDTDKAIENGLSETKAYFKRENKLFALKDSRTRALKNQVYALQTEEITLSKKLDLDAMCV
ncbi:hypothetical protein NCCP2140_31610 [Pseudoalteromonas sp. NCCP-2140]|uniref:hypothetical protein n=1 Tax=Pseudoalteromonas sp. NCCP-2140 TaxID=2942288 RepID=UPI00203E9B27|nr:hypothetical protein [Pseudoalteromonas sp. NCCP-2140]GKW54108.1 hypothetical protein NCCP2140_31610 [Pseudoalteromonas sp. NCCP-2140]